MAINWGSTFKDSPAGTDSPTAGDDKIRETREAIQERMTNEHYTVDDSESNGTTAQDWLHKPGSAKIWYQASEPASLPNGNSFDTEDAGRLWYDSDDSILYVHTGSAFASIAGSGVYCDLSTAQTVAGNKTITGSTIFQGTITGNSSADITINTDAFTLDAGTKAATFGGTMAITGNLTLTADLIGGSGTDITINTNKFTVAGSTGNTVIAGTLAVTGALTGTLATAAQTNITSLGTLTTLTVDNLTINGNTISAGSGAINITPATGSAIVLDGTISIDAGVVTGATSLTSTALVCTTLQVAGGTVFSSLATGDADNDTLPTQGYVDDTVSAGAPPASTTAAGIIEIATTAEAAALSDSDRAVTAEGVGTVTAGLRCKILNIGDWNMDSTNNVSVAHGLSLGNIRSVTAVIRKDGGFFMYPLVQGIITTEADGYISLVSTTEVVLERTNGGLFDDPDWSTTSYNRGWIVIWYVNS